MRAPVIYFAARNRNRNVLYKMHGSNNLPLDDHRYCGFQNLGNTEGEVLEYCSVQVLWVLEKTTFDFVTSTTTKESDWLLTIIYYRNSRNTGIKINCTAAGNLEDSYNGRKKEHRDNGRRRKGIESKWASHDETQQVFVKEQRQPFQPKAHLLADCCFAVLSLPGSRDHLSMRPCNL